ncbi:Hha/YmoA family nucleoid-associated regulatory protein [Xenorhabdus ishibashii]|uniref:Transcriptional regulator n=1 Tax=Xenorhabdus ishibashii TaxID=1034471 RepID=A0A2D0K7S2_9GAMM|nr:Hha/YmoA family nucleoid-associated regulatory protein [Xenorhabdus ishibashii]PHM59481.1 transcriptional regulator [Xenorhabdus ishibashii]
MKNKFSWLRQLRKCQNLGTLGIVSERILTKLTSKEKESFQLASDHRKAEIIMNKHYDHIPVSVWKYVE